MSSLHPKLTILICVLAPFNLACADVVTLKDGQQRVGHIAGQLENVLLFEVQPAPTLPPVQLRFPLAHIASLKFEKNPAADELLRLAATGDSLLAPTQKRRLSKCRNRSSLRTPSSKHPDA